MGQITSRCRSIRPTAHDILVSLRRLRRVLGDEAGSPICTRQSQAEDDEATVQPNIRAPTIPKNLNSSSCPICNCAGIDGRWN
jgi:hypothetical protein